MKSPLNRIVSYFNGYYDLIPKDANLLELLEDSRQVEEIKCIQNEPNKEQREKLKSAIMQVTVSGRFKEKRLINNLTEHSGLICIDIDLKENTHIKNYHSLKNIISSAPFVSYISCSVSGMGLFVIIPIQHPTKHVEHFLALEALFKKMGIVVDRACKDVTRMRCKSYDPAPFVNHQAKPFTGTIDIPQPKARSTNFKYQNLEGDNTKSWVERNIQELMARKIDITSSYADWVQQGFALASEFGESGRDYFHDISSVHASYDSDRCDKQFDRCLKRDAGGVGIGSFFHACKIAGVDLTGFNWHANPSNSGNVRLIKSLGNDSTTKPVYQIDVPVEMISADATVSNIADDQCRRGSYGVEISRYEVRDFDSSQVDFDSILGDLDSGATWGIILRRDQWERFNDEDNLKSYFLTLSRRFLPSLSESSKVSFINARFKAGYTRFGIISDFPALGFRKEWDMDKYIKQKTK